MTKAPLGQEQNGPKPTDRRKRGVKRSLLVEGHGVPLGLTVEGVILTHFGGVTTFGEPMCCS